MKEFRIHTADGFSKLFFKTIDEKLRQSRDVSLPVTKRRNVDTDNVQPELEVAAEPPLLHSLLQIRIGR